MVTKRFKHEVDRDAEFRACFDVNFFGHCKCLYYNKMSSDIDYLFSGLNTGISTWVPKAEIGNDSVYRISRWIHESPSS